MNEPRYFLISDKDKAAFINLINAFLKQINPSLGIDSQSFKDIPSIEGKPDLTVFIAVDKWESQALDVLDKKNAFTFTVKEVKPSDIKDQIMESLSNSIKKGLATAGIIAATALTSPSVQAQTQDQTKTPKEYRQDEIDSLLKSNGGKIQKIKADQHRRIHKWMQSNPGKNENDYWLIRKQDSKLAEGMLDKGLLAGLLLSAGLTWGQIKPEYKAKIDSISKVQTLSPQEKRSEIAKLVQLNRDDITGKKRADFLKTMAAAGFTDEEEYKKYLVKNAKKDNVGLSGMYTSKDGKKANDGKSDAVSGPSTLSKINPFKGGNACPTDDKIKKTSK